MPHVGELKYHIVWCTKYRLNVLKGEIEVRLKQLIAEKCEVNKYTLEEIEVMPDHIHIFVGASSRTNVTRIVSQLKGYTAHELRKEFKILKTRMPNLWTRSYYAGTVGHVSEKTVQQYIANQKTRS
jgi:putative transposase